MNHSLNLSLKGFDKLHHSNTGGFARTRTFGGGKALFNRTMEGKRGDDEVAFPPTGRSNGPTTRRSHLKKLKIPRKQQAGVQASVSTHAIAIGTDRPIPEVVKPGVARGLGELSIEPSLKELGESKSTQMNTPLLGEYMAVSKTKTSKIFGIRSDDLQTLFEKKYYQMPLDLGRIRLSLNLLRQHGYARGLCDLLSTDIDSGIFGGAEDIKRRQRAFGVHIHP